MSGIEFDFKGGVLVLRSRNNSAITISKEQERRDGSTSKTDRIE